MAEFDVPSLLTLMQRIRNDLASRVLTGGGVLRVSLLYILTRVYAGAVQLLYRFINFISINLFVATATGKFLDWLGAQFGLTRNPPAYATGVLSVTATGSVTDITDLTWFCADNGVTYICLDGGGLSAGTYNIDIRAMTQGAAGNLPAGLVLSLTSPVANLNTNGTVGSTGITGGSDLETDDHFRARILAFIQTPSMGGDDNDYATWMSEVAGVFRAYVFANYYGPGTVVGCFGVAGDNPAPSEILVKQVQEYVDDNSRKPITADFTAVGLQEALLSMDISISPYNSTLVNQIIANLQALCADEGTPGAFPLGLPPSGELLLTHIEEAIETSGVNDYEITAMRMNGDGISVANVAMPEFGFPVIDTDAMVISAET